MLRQFVQLAHDTAEEEPLTLPEVAKMMHIGKSTLSACLHRDLWVERDGADASGQVGTVPDGIAEA